MRNYVIILAGGIGSRMGTNTPKQFIEIDNKPIIAYTIDNFQRNSNIDKILVVCLKGWIKFVERIVEDFSLTKVEWIIEGGSTGHDSIRNGIFFLQDKIAYNDYVIVHDAVRPIIPQRVINDLIRVSHKNGNASASVTCYPPIVYTEDFESGITDIDREHVMLTASPQAFKYSLALRCYKMAENEDIHNTTFTSSLLIHCGERVFFAKGTNLNIKITTSEDLELFKVMLKLPESLLYG